MLFVELFKRIFQKYMRFKSTAKTIDNATKIYTTVLLNIYYLAKPRRGIYSKRREINRVRKMFTKVTNARNIIYEGRNNRKRPE